MASARHALRPENRKTVVMTSLALKSPSAMRLYYARRSLPHCLAAKWDRSRYYRRAEQRSCAGADFAIAYFIVLLKAGRPCLLGPHGPQGERFRTEAPKCKLKSLEKAGHVRDGKYRGRHCASEAWRLGLCCSGVHGCRFRRHWHESPLHPAGRDKSCKPARSYLARGSRRYRVADLLVIDHRHFHQICDPDHARRQSWRGRNPGTARLGESATRQGEPAARRHGRRRSHWSDACSTATAPSPRRFQC